MTQDHFSLSQAAEILALERLRLIRLGHHLRLAPGDPCIPRAVIDRARHEPEAETRYRHVLEWLLAHLPERGPSDRNPLLPRE
ncbi:MAG TPA: hypothetical protein VKX16_19040 [Chloroflexota bacterium]|nr:hypothetical protein [Chloroflexota bacterium]